MLDIPSLPWFDVCLIVFADYSTLKLRFAAEILI